MRKGETERRLTNPTLPITATAGLLGLGLPAEAESQGLSMGSQCGQRAKSGAEINDANQAVRRGAREC